MKFEFKQCGRPLLLGAAITGLAGTAAAVDPGAGVGAPGIGVLDPGLNQPGGG